MFEKKMFLIFICSVFVFCEAAFVDNLRKCPIADGVCQKNLIQSVFRDIGKTGIPDYGIPPTDPFSVQNVTISVLNMIDITMVDGVAKGFKDCNVDRFEAHVEEEKATLELTCDFVIKGKYKVEANSPLIQNLLGGSSVHGDGNARVKIDKMHMKFDYHFYIRDRDGKGTLFVDCRYEDLKYSYTLGKISFAANNLYLGETDASGLIIGLLNDNWKFIMSTFGKPFLDKAMDIAYEHAHKFFEIVPVKYYITDDLTPYIKYD